jgi:hypothetical protein
LLGKHKTFCAYYRGVYVPWWLIPQTPFTMPFFTIKGKTPMSPSLSVNLDSVVYARTAVGAKYFVYLRLSDIDGEVSFAYEDSKERDEAFDVLTNELAKAQTATKRTGNRSSGTSVV